MVMSPRNIPLLPLLPPLSLLTLLGEGGGQHANTRTHTTSGWQHRDVLQTGTSWSTLWGGVREREGRGRQKGEEGVLLESRRSAAREEGRGGPDGYVPERRRRVARKCSSCLGQHSVSPSGGNMPIDEAARAAALWRLRVSGGGPGKMVRSAGSSCRGICGRFNSIRALILCSDVFCGATNTTRPHKWDAPFTPIQRPLVRVLLE